MDNENDCVIAQVGGIDIWIYAARPKCKPTLQHDHSPNSAAHITKAEWFGTWQKRMIGMGKHIRAE